LEGRLVKRYKRFLADVRLADGTVVTAHCANPGSMKTCLEEGGKVWLSDSKNPARKLRHTWEIAEVGKARIYVNPLRANDVVAEALERGVVTQLLGYSQVRREVRFGESSRVDFVLEGKARRCFLEVKNVTLGLGEGRSAFPDSVSKRGARHLEELIREKRRGSRSVLLFCASRSDANSVEAAKDIDPGYASALTEAAAAGVEILAYKAKISLRGVSLFQELPVLLPS
jgi:sugar fermentation stimulation protein A